MPMPYGITRGCPLTKTVRWVWTCVTVFSEVWHWIPSIVCPDPALISVANFGPLGTGICSGPNVVLGAGTNVMEAGMATVGTWGLVVAGFTVFEPLVATTTMSTTTAR